MIGGIVHQHQLRFDCLPKWRMQKKQPSFEVLEQSVLYSISFYIIASYKKHIAHIDYVYTFQVLSRTQMLRVNVRIYIIYTYCTETLLFRWKPWSKPS